MGEVNRDVSELNKDHDEPRLNEVSSKSQEKCMAECNYATKETDGSTDLSPLKPTHIPL